jgi:hypothetical protein
MGKIYLDMNTNFRRPKNGCRFPAAVYNPAQLAQSARFGPDSARKRVTPVAAPAS